MERRTGINKDIDELVYICRLYGNDSDMVQAGGGNASVKINGHMWIKASGVMLKEIQAKRDFVRIDLNKVRSILKDTSFLFLPDNQRDAAVNKQLFSARAQNGLQRHSIEIFLHAALGKKFVVHTHPVYLNAMACSANGRRIASTLFDKSEYIWMPYRKPGYPLGQALYLALLEHKKRFNVIPGVVFLQNHGLIIGGDHIKEIENLTDKVIRSVCEFFGGYNKEKKGFKENNIHRKLILYFLHIVNKRAQEASYKAMWSRCPYVNLLSLDRKLMNQALRGALYPDQIVYCGAQPVLLEKNDSETDIENKLSKFFKTNKHWPRYAIIPEAGVFILGKNTNELNIREELLRAHLKILMLILRKDRPVFIPDSECRYLAQWDAEKYRQRSLEKKHDN